MYAIRSYYVTAAALAILGRGFWQRVQVYRQGRKLERTDELAARVLDALRAALTQAKVVRVAGAGTAHGLFFWGFFLLFVGTCLIVVQADFTDLLFGVKFLKGTFYKLFSLVLDIAGAVAIVMLAGLFVRNNFV